MPSSAVLSSASGDTGALASPRRAATTRCRRRLAIVTQWHGPCVSSREARAPRGPPIRPGRRVQAPVIGPSKQEDAMTIKRPEIVATVVAGCATLGLLSTLAFANHVTIRTSETVVVPGTVPATPPAVTAPADRPVIVVPPAPPQPQMQTLQVEDIRAHVVRAQTIYANEIDADQVQGMI